MSDRRLPADYRERYAPSPRFAPEHHYIWEKVRAWAHGAGDEQQRMNEGAPLRHHRGPKGYRRSDERIHEAVCETISEHSVDASDVTVIVQSGECTLEGTVPSRWDKHMVEYLTERVRGVDDVHNRLRVDPTPSSTRVSVTRANRAPG